MTLNGAVAQNPFTDLMRNQNGETIQDFLNPVHDALFKFKNITDEDQQELKQKLDQVSGDKLFNEFIVKFFCDGLNAFEIKSSIQNISDFPNIRLQDALHVLSDVYSKTTNDLIKGYILFLIFDVNDFMKFAVADWDKVKLDNSLFHHYIIDEALPKYIKDNYTDVVIDRPDHGYCLLSFICQNDLTNQAVIPANIKYANIHIDWEQCQDLNSVFSQLVNNYEHLNEPHTTKGFDINGSFENAVKLFTFVAPNWDNLAATFSLRNKPLPTASGFGLAGGARVSDSDLVKIFAGSYNLVPYTEPKASAANLDVIADFNAYNQLSSRRKLQVANFLINNRKRFNDVLGEAAQLVINGLQTKLNSTPSFSSFTPTYARSVGFNGENDEDIETDAKSFISKLSKQFKSINIQTFDQAIGFIVHNYIPMLRQFQNRCNETYGLAKAQSIISKYSTDRTLNVIGVAANLPSLSYENSLSGAAKRPTVVPADNSTVAPTPASTPTAVAQSQLQEQPQSQPQTQTQSTPLITGAAAATASANIVEAFIEGQKQFNKEYESIYRRLITALNGVNINNVHAQSFAKLYSVCNQFDSIAIKNAKTTSYLSGYYGAKNYNRIYTKCVENTIRSIEEASVPAFNECVNVLKQLKDLMTSTAHKVQELRNKFINSPKAVSEMLIIAAHKIKRPCQLTQKDFNNLTEAVNRIYNTIRNYTSETSSYNTKQQLENYIGKIEDRAKVINEHYDLIIQGLRIKYQEFPINNREREYAKEAQTTILNQIRDIMLYLNKTFDAKLAKERINHLHDVNLTQQQVDAIEKAFLAFRNVRITTEFKEQMEKLNRSLDPLTVGSVFKIVKKLRKVIIKSQYLQFIAQLYKELNIFSEAFNWDEFIDKYTSLIVLSSVRIEPLYKVGSERFTLEGIAHKAACEFENLCVNTPGFIVEDNNNEIVHNAGYSFILDYLRKQIVVEAPKGIAEFKSIVDLFGDISVFDTYLKASEQPTNDAGLIGKCADLPLTKDSFNNKFSKQSIKTDKGFKIERKNEGCSFVEAVGNGFDSPTVSSAAKQAILTANSIINAYSKINDKPKPFFYSRLAAYIDVLYKALLGSNNFHDFVKNPIERMDYWGVSVVEGSSELPIAEYTIDSLFANIVAIVDKYWAVKYNGNLPVPLNINTILRGGMKGGAVGDEEAEKVLGGSVFDSMPLHDQSFSSVIPEAVPFYICALHICQYYINTFTIDRIKTEDQNFQLVLSVNKISTLYPVYEIFQKYNATVQSLTPQQLKICLAVFNEYWNQTQGNEAARLSRAIDLIFNELNACFIFTDKLQYDLMKSTNSLSKISVDVINDKLQYLVNTMKDRLKDSMLDLHEDPALQAKRLEGLLNTAFKEIKRNPESQRLSILKALLSKQDDGGELREFYAFMETVVSPLLVCAKAYINIFSLFDNYSFDADKGVDGYNKQVESIDLNKVYIRWQDRSATNKDQAVESVETAWGIIQAIVNGSRSDLKVLFIENPIVIKYNRLMLNQSLAQLHQTGKFAFPRFWIVIDENTYPKSPVISVNLPDTIHKIDTIPLLRQIYPTVQAKNVADYYNHCVSEFISDYDHFIHAFLSYPGLSDKTIKLIANKAHDAFKISNIPLDKEYNSSSKPNKFTDDHVYSLRKIGTVDVEADILANAKPLYNIPVTKVNYFINPPCPTVGTIVPRFPDVVDVEELEIVGASKIDTVNCVQLDGCGVYIKSKSASADGINICEYNWLDWVIYQVARCNNLTFCLPYRFLQLLQDSPALNNNLRLPGSTKYKADGIQKYNRNSAGIYANVLTQNIILRSSSASNKDKADLSSLNTTWAANLVSIIPYVISTLTANKLSMEPSVTYNNQLVAQQINQLIDVLTAFYDEIGNFAPFIAFMSNSVNINAPAVKPHLFAELLSVVIKNDIQTLDINDFVKLEWANQYFFNYIDNLAFPEYKNRDRFEWIKQFAADKINNGVFRTEFETSVQSLGRLVWASLIAKSNNYVAEFKNTYRELDTTIIKIINIMSEVDTGITNQFIQNVVAEFNNQYVESGTGYKLSGGSIGFKQVEMNESNIEFIRRLSRGLFNSVQAVSNDEANGYESYMKQRFMPATVSTAKPQTITPVTTPEASATKPTEFTPVAKPEPKPEPKPEVKPQQDLSKVENKAEAAAKGNALSIEPVQTTPVTTPEPEAKPAEIKETNIPIFKVDVIDSQDNKKLSDVIKSGAATENDKIALKDFITMTQAGQKELTQYIQSKQDQIKLLNDKQQIIDGVYSSLRDFRNKTLNFIINNFGNKIDPSRVDELIRKSGLFANPKGQSANILKQIINGDVAAYEFPYINNLKTSKLNIDDNKASEVLKYYHALANLIIFANIMPFLVNIKAIDEKYKDPSEDKVISIGILLLLSAGPIAQLIKLNKAALAIKDNMDKYIQTVISICSNILLINIDNFNYGLFAMFPLLINENCAEYIKLDNLISNGARDANNEIYRQSYFSLQFLQVLTIMKDFSKVGTPGYKAISDLIDVMSINGMTDANKDINELVKEVAGPLPNKLNPIFQTPINPFKQSVAHPENYVITNDPKVLSMMGGTLFINGGSFDKDKVKTILQVAAGIAQEVRNRAVYYDLTQTFNSCPLLITPTGTSSSELNVNSLNLDGYYYKYLYNPNLCMLFNKSGFDSRDFIIYILAHQKRFVINPFTPATDSVVDWNKVNMKLSDSVCSQFGLANETSIKTICPDLTNKQITVKTDEIKNWFKQVVLYRDVRKQELKDLKDIPNYLSSNNETIPQANKINDREIESVALFNNGTLRRPIAHNVKINDDMFLLAPGNSMIMRYLFSPQKDIFNATLYDYEDVGVPTMLNFKELIQSSRNGENILFYNFTNQLNHMCMPEMNESVFAADSQLTPGTSIYADCFKLVSNFCNPQVNPIYNFIQSLIQENINSVFFDSNGLNFNNFGFDFGTIRGNDNKFGSLGGAGLTGAGLTGGFNINDNFTNSLVNINDNLEGNKELELLSTAYNLDRSNGTQKSLCKSKLLYSFMFRNSLGAAETNNNVMFHLIINYFHKYNISFNSMFNQLCFPSVLFNAAGLRLSVKRVKELIESINIPEADADKEGYKYRLFSFIKFYINNIVDKDGNISFDLAKDYKYQVSFGNSGRIEQLRMEQVKKTIEDVKTKMNAENGTLALGNQYFAPSVANNFVVEFMKYIHINTDKPIEHCEKLQSLFGSGIADALRHLDSLITFISVLFMLLKETSYYSHEYERDVTYFNTENPDVFSIV